MVCGVESVYNHDQKKHDKFSIIHHWFTADLQGKGHLARVLGEAIDLLGNVLRLRRCGCGEQPRNHMFLVEQMWWSILEIWWKWKIVVFFLPGRGIEETH